MRTSTATNTDRRDAAIVFGIATALYLVLRSRFYIGDGIRYLLPTLSPTMPAEDNKHFLWGDVLWLVCRARAWLGVAPDVGPVRTNLIALLQGINALAGALGLAILYLWLRRAASRRAAAVAVIFAGLSHAFLLHATDMTEPVAAVAPMMLGLWLLGAAPERTRNRLLAGALIGLGADFYQIALAAVVPAVWLAVRPSAPEALSSRLSRLVRAGIAIGAASVAVYAGLIGAVRWATHNPNLLTGGGDWNGNGLFGSFGLQHFAAWIFGFANSLAALPEMAGGVSTVIHERPRDLFLTLAIVTLALAFLGGLVFRLVQSRRQLRDLGRMPDVVAAAGWFTLVVLFTCWFSVLYEKFWVFACPPLAMAVALGIEPQGGGADTHHEPHERRWPIFLVPGAILLLWNLVAFAIPRRINTDPDVGVAERLAAHVTPADFLACAGWDPASVYMRHVLVQPAVCFSLTDEAIAVGVDEAAHRLAAEVSAARARNGHVYFVGLLDVSRADWDLFYGKRLGVPYETLDAYRRGAVLVDVLREDPRETLYEARPDR